MGAPNPSPTFFLIYDMPLIEEEIGARADFKPADTHQDAFGQTVRGLRLEPLAFPGPLRDSMAHFFVHAARARAGLPAPACHIRKLSSLRHCVCRGVRTCWLTKVILWFEPGVCPADTPTCLFWAPSPSFPLPKKSLRRTDAVRSRKAAERPGSRARLERASDPGGLGAEAAGAPGGQEGGGPGPRQGLRGAAPGDRCRGAGVSSLLVFSPYGFPLPSFSSPLFLSSPFFFLLFFLLLFFSLPESETEAEPRRGRGTSI